MQPALAELQAEFLRGLRRRGENLAKRGAFAPPPRGDVARRWEIYRDGYVIRLAEAMRNDYPAIARILGFGPFRSLVARYLEAFPPHAPDIGQAGARLPEFLAGDALSADLPFLPDLARFEAALAAGVVAADARPVGREEIAAMGETVFERPLGLAPGAAYIASDWPLGDLWECRDRPDDEIHVEVLGRPTKVLLHRDGLAMRWREVDAEEGAFLAAATGAGATLAALCDGGGFGPPEQAAPRLVDVLLRFLAANVICFPTDRTPARVHHREHREKEIQP